MIMGTERTVLDSFDTLDLDELMSLFAAVHVTTLR